MTLNFVSVYSCDFEDSAICVFGTTTSTNLIHQQNPHITPAKTAASRNNRSSDQVKTEGGSLYVYIVTAIAGILGYVCATSYLTFRDYGFTAAVDWTWLARSYFPLRTVRPDDFWLATMIIGGFACVGLIFAAVTVRRSRYQ